MYSGEYSVSPQSKWVNAGSITVAQAALGVDGRDYDTVQALASTTVNLIEPEIAPKALLLRFRADGNEDVDSVLQLYACRGSDHYQHIAQLTVVTGTQDTDTATIHFVDTITPASENALFDGEEVNTADGIALYYLRTLGFDSFAVICSDLDSTTVYTDWCAIYE